MLKGQRLKEVGGWLSSKAHTFTISQFVRARFLRSPVIGAHLRMCPGRRSAPNMATSPTRTFRFLGVSDKCVIIYLILSACGRIWAQFTYRIKRFSVAITVEC